MKKIYLILIIAVSFTSCDVLQQLISMSSPALSTSDVANGLKEALSVGVDTAVYRLTKEGGYYLEEKVKIHLPPEADVVVKNASKIPGMDKLIDEMELKLNRAAEDAAVLAAPIFANAIKEMSIEDAWGILRGSDTAALHYLRQKTEMKLFNSFKPHVAGSLNKPLVANVSANDSWESITSQWNKLAESFAGQLLKLKTVETNMDDYVTHKALDGLFLKVGEQEKEIRNNANARVSDLLKRVFASEGSMAQSKEQL